MKTFFIADAHIQDNNDPNLPPLVSLTGDMRKGDTLVILGDLFDFWTGFRDHVYEEYSTLLSALQGLAEKGVRIIYLEGNHDFSMGWFFTDRLKARVFPDSHELSLDRRRVYLAHGDMIDMTMGYALLRAFFRSRLSWALSRLMGPALTRRAAKLLSRKSRSRKNRRSGVGEERMQKRQSAFARERIKEGFDGVVLAHSHGPGFYFELEADGRKGFYANPGGWAGGRSYIVFEDGAFRVERYG